MDWSFVVKRVFPHEVVELEDPKGGNTFNVNGQGLKPYVEACIEEIDTIWLSDPVYGVE